MDHDAFDWCSSSRHRSSIRRNFTVVGIPEASAKSNRKAEQSATLELSTNIDTADIQELMPTRTQPPRSAKRQETQSRRRLNISAESDEESSVSPAF
ncbi:hypothetical protein V6N13_059449 [Hibiscus sabdariffa]